MKHIKVVTVAIVIAVCSLIGVTYWTAQPKSVSLESNVGKFGAHVGALSSGQGTDERSEGVPTGPYWDDIQYESITCKADWNELCKGEVPFEPVAGWQACKVIYRLDVSKNKGYIQFSVGKWVYPKDPENPDRITGITMEIAAWGSHRWWDQWGSTRRISNVGVRRLPADATNVERKALNCYMYPINS